MQPYIDKAIEIGLNVGIKVVGALILWVIGRYVVSLVARLIKGSMEKQKVDATLTRYAHSSTKVLLNVVLLIAVLSVFGVETTTFAGLLAAAGVAIGMAWSGMLSNFAAGVFMIVLRPIKSGDFVSAGGVTGTVVDIGLFVTSINTPDNVLTFVGNSKVFGENIQNFSANEFRRVDLVAQLHHDVDVEKASSLLRARLTSIPNVCSTPAVQIELLEFTLAGPVLAVRPFCNNDDYWQVYFDSNRAIREAFSEAGFPAPQQHVLTSVAA